MLRSKDIIGLPIFTIAEGKEIGKITEILVNPGRGVVIALAVENTSKIVIFSSIKNIGKDAVVIDTSSQLLEMSEHRNIERWKEIKIVDSKIITSSGQYIGKVSDFLLDVTTGKILSCVASDLEGERLIIPASRIVTFGKDALIIVDTEVEEEMEIEDKEETEQMQEVLEAAKEERKVEHEEIKTVLEQLAEEIEKEPEGPSGPDVPETMQQKEAEKPAEKPITQITPQAEPAEAGQKPFEQAAPEAKLPTAPAGTSEEPPPITADAAPKIEQATASTRPAEEATGATPPAPEVKNEGAELKMEQKEVPATPKEATQTPPAPTEKAQEATPPARDEAAAAFAQVEKKTPAQTAEHLPKEDLQKSKPAAAKKPEEQVQAILDRHQHDFLLGKTIKRDLLADDGTIILRAGDTITEETLEKARKANKYLELGFYI